MKGPERGRLAPVAPAKLRTPSLVKPAAVSMRRFLLLLLAAAFTSPATAQQRPKNVIFFITDGFGPASATLARDYVRHTEGRDALAFDSLLTGMAQTWATNSRVSDSAAGATALATGHKSYNGAIAVDTSGQILGTILEAAERKGMATGLVATTRITHATPASFSAHVPQRASENDIAAQQIEQGIEVLFGGGGRHFRPTEAGGRRTDGRDLMAELAGKGYTLAATKAEFEALRTTPAAALLADDQLAYEIDRDPAEEPSLTEMTMKAIDLLKGDRDGFFLMVEASRIDHSGHENDAASHVHDILAFEEALLAAVRWAQQDGNTLVVSTSDHEAGGLTLGRNIKGYGVYDWKPEVLEVVQTSQMRTAAKLVAGADVDSLLAADMRLTDLKDEDRALLSEALGQNRVQNVSYALSEVLGRRAILGWTTTGHTGVDVGLYAFGPGLERFRGSMPNHIVGQRVAELMGLDLDALTAELRAE